ncbi:hypothetical protein GCM10023083_80900 [Streptomyces phyllanthi]
MARCIARTAASGTPAAPGVSVSVSVSLAEAARGGGGAPVLPSVVAVMASPSCSGTSLLWVRRRPVLSLCPEALSGSGRKLGGRHRPATTRGLFDREGSSLPRS